MSCQVAEQRGQREHERRQRQQAAIEPRPDHPELSKLPPLEDGWLGAGDSLCAGALGAASGADGLGWGVAGAGASGRLGATGLAAPDPGDGLALARGGGGAGGRSVLAICGTSLRLAGIAALTDATGRLSGCSARAAVPA